jgi:hypothetical protein
MKKVLLTSLLFALVIGSTRVMAGTNTSDDVISYPAKIKDPQENGKKLSGNTYNFTLFNFFKTSTASKPDSSSTTVTESKEHIDNQRPKLGL